MFGPGGPEKGNNIKKKCKNTSTNVKNNRTYKKKYKNNCNKNQTTQNNIKQTNAKITKKTKQLNNNKQFSM